MSQGNAPVKSYRIGEISCAIWANTGQYGTMYQVTFKRSYKSQNGWQDVDSYRLTDLGTMASLAQMASVWILAQKQQSGGQNNVQSSGQNQSLGNPGGVNPGSAPGSQAGGQHQPPAWTPPGTVPTDDIPF